MRIINILHFRIFINLKCNINMKKIKLTESDLLKIVNKVLNEQEIRQFDEDEIDILYNEDEIDILYHIFERELKPPFREGKIHSIHSIGGGAEYHWTQYHNRDNEWIGLLRHSDKGFAMRYRPCFINIKYKVCQVFGFSYENRRWWDTIKPHIKYWIENQIGVELNWISLLK